LSDAQDNSGTDTDTSSDYGDESWPAAEGATASEQAADLVYWGTCPCESTLAVIHGQANSECL
jgi:hypothetical protein